MLWSEITPHHKVLSALSIFPQRPIEPKHNLNNKGLQLFLWKFVLSCSRLGCIGLGLVIFYPLSDFVNLQLRAKTYYPQKDVLVKASGQNLFISGVIDIYLYHEKHRF